MNNSWDGALGRFHSELQSRPMLLVLLESILFGILQFLSIAGNSLTLFVIWKAQNLRKTANYFVACLAVSDLGMSLLLQHLLLATLVLSRWPFNEAICQYQGITAITMAAASTQTLAWTALNRYFRIVKTRYYLNVFSKEKLVAITTFIWVSSLLASSPYLIAGHRFIFHPAKFFCYLSLDVTWFTKYLVTVYVGIPTVIIVYCYLKVFKTVRKHNSNLSKKKGSLSVGEIKVTRTLFIIVLVFMGCWTPILIMDLIDTFRGRWSLPRYAYVSYTFLATFSFAVNPFIYAFANPAFKKEFSKVLRCQTSRMFPCCVKAKDPNSTGAKEKPNRLDGPAFSVTVSQLENKDKRESQVCCEKSDLTSTTGSAYQ